jgi:hypothetical protein
MARRSWSASPAEKPAQTRATAWPVLEQGDAKGLAEHALEFGRRKLDRLLALATAKIGVDHVALDGPGPHDRDLQ